MKKVLAELREKTDKELHDMVVKSRNELREFRFKLTSKQLKDVRDVRIEKIKVARILTLLAERKQSVN